jgi:hypothetical protein
MGSRHWLFAYIVCTPLVLISCTLDITFCCDMNIHFVKYAFAQCTLDVFVSCRLVIVLLNLTGVNRTCFAIRT